MTMGPVAKFYLEASTQRNISGIWSACLLYLKAEAPSSTNSLSLSNGIQYTDPDGNVIAFPETVDQYPVPALLDIGTSNTVLPQIITSSIHTALNADLSSPPDAYVDCSLAFISSTIDYILDGIAINVPLSQLITPNGPGNPFTECPPSFQTASAGGPVVLGDSFLSSA
jgi:hypothetical protein